MKKVLILGVILFIALYSSVFTVKDNTVAIVTNSYTKTNKMYTAGIYFALPFIQQVNYIEVNQRSSVFVTPFILKGLNNVNETQDNLTDYTIKTLINWHIAQPIVYFEYTQKNFDVGISKVLALNVESILHLQLKPITNVAKLNQVQNILADQLFLPTIGGVIDNISLINVTKTDNSESTVKQDNVTLSRKNTIESALNDNAQAIESAYYFAQKIKDQTAITEINLYRQIENKNPRFYEYFRVLELYKTNAKSKSELPPLNQLYK